MKGKGTYFRDLTNNEASPIEANEREGERYYGQMNNNDQAQIYEEEEEEQTDNQIMDRPQQRYTYNDHIERDLTSDLTGGGGGVGGMSGGIQHFKDQSEIRNMERHTYNHPNISSNRLNESELQNEGELIGYSEQIIGRINDMAPGIPTQDEAILLNQQSDDYANFLDYQPTQP